MLVEVRLPCGCLVLCDQDGPCCVLEPCADYPEGDGDDLRDAYDWAGSLRRYRERWQVRRKEVRA